MKKVKFCKGIVEFESNKMGDGSILLFFNLGFFDLLLGFFLDLGLPLFWLHEAEAGAAGALEQELHFRSQKNKAIFAASLSMFNNFVLFNSLNLCLFFRQQGPLDSTCVTFNECSASS
ncbi:uncharacterized protein HKW66_Vig0240880 [Vigna angularis]|uniref:Uncharacterized protein n=1 Tax=Phaseolus angularis TaxID=3914 RepID=A0A8T0JGW1_PHAAN|nr:uncharacterized protein HKW66_Vig0240880 [Vigna angularis]